jgi:perosamine synthetase
MNAAPIALFGGTPAIAPGIHGAWPVLGDGEKAAILRVFERGVLSGANAPEAVAFENEFATFVQAKHALLTHSGTSALHLALAASGIEAGDHVIVPAYSFVATPLAVLHAGAIPIFADVDERTGLIDPASVESVITPRTRAIMPVHIHGCAADLTALNALARRHDLSIVEDAAQAHGATCDGRAVGAIGRAGGFSLQSSKNLGAGEGGVFTTNDDAVADAANRIRNFGQNVLLADRTAFDSVRPLDAARALDSGRIGWMYRGNEFTAATARALLARLPERTAQCQANAARLSSALAELPGVVPPIVPPGATSVHHKFRVAFDLRMAGVEIAPRLFRDAIIRALRAEGLEVVLWQTAPLSAQPVFRRREGFGGGWPWTTDRGFDFDKIYSVGSFPATQRLLDGSILLFSQSHPLIAQSSEVVDRYGEAFTRVWSQRREIARWAIENLG